MAKVQMYALVGLRGCWRWEVEGKVLQLGFFWILCFTLTRVANAVEF